MARTLQNLGIGNEQCLKANTAAIAATPAVPVFNFSIGGEVAKLFVPLTMLAVPAADTNANTTSSKLLPVAST
jgi:hypothetical protein